MITESSKLPKKTYELCVIGTGPAGMIVALEFAKKNPTKTVLLAEFGKPKQSPTNSLDDSIKNLNPRNHHDPYECTNKGLGGTSITWGGRCVMYDEVDFVDRAILNGGCTWDLDLFHEVNEHQATAASYFECGSGPFDTEKMPALRGRQIAENFEEQEVLDRLVERWSMPTRFGSRYRRELLALPNLTLVQGLEAREIQAPDDQGKIPAITLRQSDGPELTIKARTYVLAAGTQETTRLLLRNLQIFRHLPAPPPALGRFYQGHVSGKIASVRFSGNPRKTDYGFHRDPDGSYFRRRFQLSTEALVQNNLLNTAMWLDNPLYHDPSHGNGAMSLMYLAMITPILGKRLAPPAIANSVTKGKVQAIDRHLWNVIRGLPSSLFTPASIFFRRYCLKRKLPGIFLYNPQNRYALHFHAEQVPHPDNRMTLGKDGETLEIHYDLTDSDLTSVIRNHEILDSSLRRRGCGELEYWFDQKDLPEAIRQMSRDGIHQSGTTRIGNSPQEGVVDRNLKVWGANNLFLCSSSTFPTSGQANPTFFLGMFAARLAQHLTQLKSSS